MAGIVVSSKRLICHNPMRQREAMTGEALEIENIPEEAKNRLRIKSPDWEVRKLAVDREGLVLLKAALAKGEFRVTWR
jgi:hypothetical protein